jgi:membrane peptidoglycan carboxypeptidase
VTQRIGAQERLLGMRRVQWKKLGLGTLIGVVVLAVAAGAGAEAYVRSVPLPDAPDVPQASTLYFNDGRTILARLGTVDRTDVPLSQVPVAVRRAIVATEDGSFYDHPGFSITGVLRAAWANLTGGSREGASTITQQYARNAFLTQDVSYERKTKEIALAVQLERRYSKDEILERYLNTIYYGRGAQGIAAAAHAYFGISPSQLTVAQGSMLASVIKDPYLYDPAHDAVNARKRWNWVIGQQRRAGWLDDASTPAAYPDVLKPAEINPGPDGIIIDRVEAELAAKGVSSQQLHTKGLSVVTTVDAAMQRAAVDQVTKQKSKLPKDLRAVLVALDPKTGGVLAYYGGEKRGFYDDAAALHPAASTFKPIVLSAALRRGLDPGSVVDATSPQNFRGRLGVPLKNQDNVSCPQCTLTDSMVQSLNTPFYALTEQFGPNLIRDEAYKLGISERYGDLLSLRDVKGDPMPGKTRSDISIGRYAVTPRDLATVYATFASGGVRTERHFVRTVTAPGDRVLHQAAEQGERVLPAGVASGVSATLSAVVKADNISPGRPAAGKTGTQQWGDTSDNQDAWMAGYTPDLASVVWIGKARPGPIRDKQGAKIEGSTVPARLWSDFTREALKGHPATDFPLPLPVSLADAKRAAIAGQLAERNRLLEEASAAKKAGISADRPDATTGTDPADSDRAGSDRSAAKPVETADAGAAAARPKKSSAPAAPETTAPSSAAATKG